MFSTSPCCVLWEKAACRVSHNSTLQSYPKHCSSTLTGASEVSRTPDVHSSKMRWWTMARASAPWGPTPSRRIAVVRTALSPSLSATSRLETHFRTKLPDQDRSNFLGVHLTLVLRHALFGDVCGDCSRLCERSDPLIVMTLFQEMSSDPLACQDVRGSRCSSRSPERFGARKGASLTWRSDAIPVLLRPSSLVALRASLYLPALQAARAA